MNTPRSSDSLDWRLSLVDRHGRQVQVFRAWDKVVSHLRYHLLTLPESLGWSLLMPELLKIGDLANPDRCWEMQRELSSEAGADSPCELGRGLYRLYARGIADALQPAGEAAEASTPENFRLTLGLSGVLVIVERFAMYEVVVTAFIPGMGDAQVVSQANALRRYGQEADRQYDWKRSGRNAGKSKRGPQLKFESQRFAGWSHAERVYHALFRPALQFIRSRVVKQCRNRDGTEDYARLKEPLGPRSNWSYKQWSVRWIAATLDQAGGGEGGAL